MRPVVSIESEGRAKVYDISVPGTETFLGGVGGVLLHNSKTRRMANEGNDWLLRVMCCVVDEAHLLTMEGRGDALEVGVMRFTRQNPHARVVFLSATMPNVSELARWLT